MSPALAPQNDMDKAALITQLVVSAVNLDYAGRALQAHRKFSGNAKRRLNLLVQASDSFLSEAIKAFDFHDADGINALSDVVTEHQRLLLQCTPRQIQASLEHLHGMVSANMAYVPAPTSATDPLNELQTKYNAKP